MKKKPEQLSRVPDLSNQVKKDIEYSIEMSRWFLKPIGLWPIDPHASTTEKCLLKILIVIASFLLSFNFIPTLLHVIIIEKNLEQKLIFAGPICFGVMVISKYYFLLAKHKSIRKCFKHIDTDWHQIRHTNDRKIMWAYAKHSRFIMSFCAIFLYAGGIFYHTIAPLARGTILTANNVSIRPLPHPGFIVVETSPLYEIFFIAQWFSDFVRYSVGGAMCSLGVTFVLHICGQLKIIMSRLEEFIDADTLAGNIKSKTATIVELHLRSMNFISRIEKLLNEVCLIEVLGSTLVLCLIGYCILVEIEKEHTRAIEILTYSVLLVSFTFNIFIFCYIGEMLSRQKEKIGNTAYMIKWYKLSGKDAKILILIIKISHYSNNLTAGKMMTLSYHSFSAIIRTSIAYLNLLRTLIL
ncbi:putative odorant receptor 83c [Chelonus insularis]|uniref:putative odorant receptor 83c n=1 Tax=Chelonus insularis TaxID=460826 RepID=UPI0015888123|nr:putative odorant receptor 83c [Chelonus insularis]